MNGLQSALAPAGEQASSIHGLFWLMLLVCGAMYLLVLAAVAWSIVRALRRRGPAGAPAINPPDVGLNRGLLGWAGLIVIGLTVLIVASFLVERTIAAAAAIERHACGACHRIPGIGAATGVAGPALNGIATRSFVAGVLPNDPANLQRWIRHPQRIVPGNGMPDQGVTPQEARDIAAYLYTLRR
ncbi:c-type cytochrome [Sphingomonas sp. HT-1]|uniref:c-type cytochrome n=1 Tax=unclassified Sphingomonas TaxID=196159 RepID=UPI0002D2760D|nr:MULTISPECIES: c-type cytochrome [unclassified Sphingomonas]KTF69373.1 hypothetical protein ATB93_09495 [Sphingomonas sp. WG]